MHEHVFVIVQSETPIWHYIKLIVFTNIPYFILKVNERYHGTEGSFKLTVKLSGMYVATVSIQKLQIVSVFKMTPKSNPSWKHLRVELNPFKPILIW